jgi:hypothetical protein
MPLAIVDDPLGDGVAVVVVLVSDKRQRPGEAPRRRPL